MFFSFSIILETSKFKNFPNNKIRKPIQKSKKFFKQLNNNKKNDGKQNERKSSKIRNKINKRKKGNKKEEKSKTEKCFLFP
jgi:hypothetical protein